MNIRAALGAKKGRTHFLLLACCLLALSCLALACRSGFGRNAPNLQVQHAPTGTPDSQFAIADFDGDRHPDLATVELVRFNPLHSRYSVSFQLSRGRLQTIALTGPAGGLLLLARDVNGDRALDVVLVTARRHELLAVLLNDGSGNFASADPGQFRINVVSSRTQLATSPSRIEDRAVLALVYSLPGDLVRDTLASPTQESGLASSRSLEIANSLSESCFLGRAPPPPVHLA